MTDFPSDSPLFSTDVSKPFIQIPIERVRYVRSLKLTGVQYDLWLYLYELDPYGDRWVEIPSPDELGLLLGVNTRTILRAAQRLADCELFEFQIKRWRARNTMVSAKAHNFHTDKEIRMRTKRSKSRQMDHFVQNGISLSEVKDRPFSEVASGRDSGDGECTNNNKQTYSETTEQNPPTHPVFPELDREGIGTSVSSWLAAIAKAGIKPNRTIARVLGDLEQELDPAAAQAVENAISALQEQQQQGTVRNPGGFLVAALRGSFTANQAKKQSRMERQNKPPDLVQVSLAIDQALLRGDRSFALAKLQNLWQQGWQQQVEELCQLRKQDWGFVVAIEGVEDSRGNGTNVYPNGSTSTTL